MKLATAIAALALCSLIALGQTQPHPATGAAQPATQQPANQSTAAPAPHVPPLPQVKEVSELSSVKLQLLDSKTQLIQIYINQQMEPINKEHEEVRQRECKTAGFPVTESDPMTRNANGQPQPRCQVVIQEKAGGDCRPPQMGGCQDPVWRVRYVPPTPTDAK